MFRVGTKESASAAGDTCEAAGEAAGVLGEIEKASESVDCADAAGSGALTGGVCACAPPQYRSLSLASWS